MPRSIDQILAEVNSKTDPQRQTILRQVADIPNQMQAEEASLGAKKTEAFDEILGGARRRGLGFSGIPIGEQARYAATEYAPAVARMKTGFNERRGTLESALADIDRSNYFQAQDIFARDRDFEENQRRFELQRQEAQRAAASAAAPKPSWMDYLMGSGAKPVATQPTIDPEEAKYRAWLNTQLKVTTSPTRSIVPPQSRVQGSAPRLQGGAPVKLQGRGSKPSGGRLTVR